MTEILIENPLVLENNEINNNEKEKIFCLKCNKRMHKLVLKHNICSICLTELKKEDAEQKKL